MPEQPERPQHETLNEDLLIKNIGPEDARKFISTINALLKKKDYDISKYIINVLINAYENIERGGVVKDEEKIKYSKYTYLLLAEKLGKNVDDITDQDVDKHIKKHRKEHQQKLDAMPHKVDELYKADREKWNEKANKHIRSFRMN